MKFTEHIELSDCNGQCVVSVRDVELHDFLDDLFAQADMEPRIVMPPSEPLLQFIFPVGISVDAVHRVIAEVRMDEIEQIVGVNASHPAHRS